jgi:arabinosyltransferase
MYADCRDIVMRIADKDGYVMVTWANDHYYDFVRNWVEHIESLGISAFMVGAMDNRILGQLLLAGIPCFAMQSGLTHEDFGWGSKNFHAMVRGRPVPQASLRNGISQLQLFW